MHDVFLTARPWFKFAGFVLVVAVLYWAQVVIVPVALALLLTFVLTPAVAPLQRRVGRVAAVLLVVAVTFAALGLAARAITIQLTNLAAELPTYQHNVRQKVRDVRWLGKGGSVEKLQDTVESIESEMARGEPSATTKALVVEPAPVSTLWGLPSALGPWLEPLATAAFVMTLVIFMLLERQDLRNRVISLFGQRHLTLTTRAFDDAALRVRRYLVRQSLINLFFGVSVGVGLYIIGVPYAVVWAALAAILRFVPYVGMLIASVAPILVSLAAFDDWARPFMVLGLYLVIELVTNVVVEPFLYAGAAGVSQVALLISIAFWTWLWGPLGILLATPLTVCLVVIGKHVPGFEFIATLLADTTVLQGDVSFYQRLLAGDQAEAADLIEDHAKADAADKVFDALFIPALTYAERDRMEGHLSAEEEHVVVEASRELLDEALAVLTPPPAEPSDERQAAAIEVLGWPAHGEADALALQMLGILIRDTPFNFETLPAPASLAGGIRLLRERNCRVVCIGDLPPGAPSKSRYLAKRLRAAVPGLTILIGRWAPPQLADEISTSLREAGADDVSSTLLETREELLKLLSEAALAETEPPVERVAKAVG